MIKEEQIAEVRRIINMIKNNFLREKSEIEIISDDLHAVYLLGLFAKQTNLLLALLLLIENHMAEEASLMFRSMITNQMMIIYLLEGPTYPKRLREFEIQPLKNKLLFYYGARKILRNGWIPDEERYKFHDINVRIKDLERELTKRGYSKEYRDLFPISVSKLSSESPELSKIYLAYYNEASAYEHSDISSLDVYFANKVPTDLGYRIVLDTSRYDIPFFDKILDMGPKIYFRSFFILFDFLKEYIDFTNLQKEIGIIALSIHRYMGLESM